MCGRYANSADMELQSFSTLCRPPGMNSHRPATSHPPNLSASSSTNPTRGTRLRAPVAAPDRQLGLAPCVGQGSEDGMPTFPDSGVGRTVTVVCPPPRMGRRMVQCNRSASSTSGFNGGVDGWASLASVLSAAVDTR